MDLPNFVHKIITHPDLLCVFGQRDILNEMDIVLQLDSPSPQLLSYDTTFKLGDFYISTLSFRHTLFKESPTIPAVFLLHERKFEAHHKEMFQICCNLVPSLQCTTYPIVTDEERDIVNCISDVLPNCSQLRCWNHIFRDARRWLKSHGALSLDTGVYLNDIRSLFHVVTQKGYDSLLTSMKSKWSAPFFDYYNSNINSDIECIARWGIESYGVYNPYSGVTNNQAESLNFVIKQLQDWKEAPPDCMILSLYYLQSYYMAEIIRGQCNLGNYHVHSQFGSIVCTQSLPETIYSPDEIVQQIKGNYKAPTVTIETSFGKKTMNSTYHRKKELND